MNVTYTRMAFAILLSLGVLLTGAGRAIAATHIAIFADPDCDCCKKWAEYLRREGFAVTIEYRSDLTATNDQLGVPESLRGCHVATVDGYVIEGHVPAEDIRRLLRERPKAVGLSVPGMPIGAPGMEQGSARTPYEVILFGGGTTSQFAMH